MIMQVAKTDLCDWVILHESEDFWTIRNSNDGTYMVRENGQIVLRTRSTISNDDIWHLELAAETFWMYPIESYDLSTFLVEESEAEGARAVLANSGFRNQFTFTIDG